MNQHSPLALAVSLIFVIGLSACKPAPPMPSVGPAESTEADPDFRPNREVPLAPIADPREGRSAADEDLASRIESALGAETSLHGARIGVLAADGVVTLTGTARSADLRSMASQIALSVDGVKLVRNELAVAMET